MRRLLTAAALVSGLALGGCDSFDPLDKLQELDIMGTSKKPLVGDRRAVFPEGVPGVAQGVPPELVKGYQAAARDAAAGGRGEAGKAQGEAEENRCRAAQASRSSAAANQQQMQQAPAAQTTTTQPVGQSAGGDADRCPARSRPGRPTHSPRPAPGPARSAKPAKLGYTGRASRGSFD